jgi:hypothetical protein
MDFFFIDDIEVPPEDSEDHFVYHKSNGLVMNPPNMFLMKSQVMKLQGNSVQKRMEH